MSNSSSNSTEELGIRLNADGVAEFVLNVNQGGKAVDDFGRKADGANKPIQTTTEKIAATGNTAKQTAAAFRLLPAQITDVVTSLASGQPAWLVAIQQGGQIKDSFGGIGPMFRELAAALGPTRLALGGTGVAVAALLAIHHMGAAEAREYAKALTLTGNAAGTNADQLADMARRLDAVVGTQSKAAEVLAMLAATGEVASANLEGFAETAIRMERSLDAPLGETVKNFQDLGRAPLEATLRLNRGVNYLTASVYEQIRALMAQGREWEAGAVAQKAYAEAMNGSVTKVAENLGLLQRIGQGVVKVFKEIGDAALSIGRKDTLDDRIAQLRAQLEKANKPFDPHFGGNAEARAMRTKNQQELDALLEQKRIADVNAAQDAALVQARNADLRERDSAHIEAVNAINLAQAKAAASAQEAVAARGLAVAQAQATLRETVLQQELETLENLRERDNISLEDYYRERMQLERRGAQSQIDVINQEMASERKALDARLQLLDAQAQAEQARKPRDKPEDQQQQAALLLLKTQRLEAQAQAETRLIALQAQKGALVDQQFNAEAKYERAKEVETNARVERDRAETNQRRQALLQLNEQMRQSNAFNAVDLIQDPVKRATERAKLDIAELRRYYDEKIGDVRQKLPSMAPDEAANAQAEITKAEQLKADGVLLINRRLVEDLKPEWQRMLEGWQDTTRLMRESYNDFQSGWLRSGEDAWVQYVKTGKLNIASLADFAVGEAAKFAFRSVLAKPMEQAGGFLANLIGLSGPAGGAAGGAAQTAAIGAETAARATLTTNMGLAVLPLNAMASAAADAALSLAAMSAAGASSGGSSLMGNLASFFSGGPGGSSGAPMALVAHSGALVGSSEGGRRAMPGVFAGARRYHSGGLAHDEVPAILQRGEGVYTKGQMKNMAPLDVVAQAVGGRGGPSVTQHISINIDARTDQAQVAQVARQAMVAAKAELMEEMARGQA